jgi:hypothetical protein
LGISVCEFVDVNNAEEMNFFVSISDTIGVELYIYKRFE